MNAVAENAYKIGLLADLLKLATKITFKKIAETIIQSWQVSKSIR